jgi:hypothetical protein
MSTPVLLDVSCLCDRHTDAALELMAKAVGEDPPPDDIWSPHPNPMIRRIVELFTRRGLDRIAGLRDELGRWLRGEMHVPDPEGPPRPVAAMVRWGADELAIARLYLANLPPSRFEIDDWMLLVDYLAQRYLPASDLRAESDWLVTRAAMMGRVQAALGETSERRADEIVVAIPPADGLALAIGMTPEQRGIIDYGKARCGEHVTAVSDALRHRLRNLIVNYQEAVFLGDIAATSESLQTKLLDEFGLANRDWRRIAVTEATENANQGFIAAVGPGAKVRRVEKYRGACAFCRSIDGLVCDVVPASQPGKDGAVQVWVGKTNVGRSASPKRREGGALVDREAHEMWWPAAGAQHPHCRGAWVKVAAGASEDPEFEAWLAALDKRGKA